MTSSTRFVFSADAQQDLDDIQQYTLSRWGERQLERYQGELHAAFERLRAFPEMGRPVERGFRELPVSHHVILYRYENDAITILRVMHPRRLRR